MQLEWKKVVNTIVYSLIVYMAAGLLAGIFDSIASLHKLSGALGGSSNGIWGVLAILMSIASIGGFVWFFVNVNKFIPLQKDASDAAAITGVRNAYIVSIAGIILAFIPAVGWIFSLICGLVSAIMLIMNYGKFSNSPVMNAVGKTGASNLKVAAILSLVGSILAIIPAVGWIFALICGIISIVFIFLGWTKVSNGCPA